MALVKHPKTPSKFMSLQVLKQILENNRIADNGQEYNEYELKQLIEQKEMRYSDRIMKKLDRKDKALLQAWERVESWRLQIRNLQRKINKERKKYGI